MHKIYWDATAQPIGASFADVIYHLRADDADDLLMDAVSVDDFELDAAEVYDALDVEYRMLERKMNVMRRIMNRADADLKVREDNGPDDMGVNITKPFKRNGTQNIAVIFQLTDGQTVTIVLHNPDLDPGNIKPDDASGSSRRKSNGSKSGNGWFLRKTEEKRSIKYLLFHM